MPTVFISYSHKDVAWKERLVTHLSVLADEGLFEVWDDTRIGAGQEWEREIEEAMRGAAVTVLMVSPDFLASKFVKTKEIPPLLQRREQEGLRVIPVIVRPCPWQRISWLSAMQARPKDGRPLSGGTDYQIDADLAAVAVEIADIIEAQTAGSSAAPATSTATQQASPAPEETAPVAPKEPAKEPVRSQPAPAEAAPKEPAKVVEKPAAPPAPAARPAVPDITEPIRMELVRVPAGPFLMGSDKAKDQDAFDGELPQHTVEVAEFYIGRYPVTNAQYAAFAKATGRTSPSAGKENHPVVNVTWHDAVAFTEWLSAATGKGVRLPTEAEWEKAARGADGRIYPWGNAPDTGKANYGGREGGTTPVGAYSEKGGDSPYGVADMAGNVWEWTSSLYKKYKYDPNDGREDMTATGNRVLRGGSFYNNEGSARCARRATTTASPLSPSGHRGGYYGFRVGVSPGL